MKSLRDSMIFPPTCYLLKHVTVSHRSPPSSQKILGRLPDAWGCYSAPARDALFSSHARLPARCKPFTLWSFWAREAMEATQLRTVANGGGSASYKKGSCYSAVTRDPTWGGWSKVLRILEGKILSEISRFLYVGNYFKFFKVNIQKER